MTPLKNKGLVTRTNNGYIGRLNIENVIFDIQTTFWSDKSPNYIWVQRPKEKNFDEKTKTFMDYIPKPFFECYAYKAKKNDIMAYRGDFMFVGFKYELIAWYEDKNGHQMNFEVERSKSQPILNRLNEINKEQSNDNIIHGISD